MVIKIYFPTYYREIRPVLDFFLLHDCLSFSLSITQSPWLLKKSFSFGTPLNSIAVDLRQELEIRRIKKFFIL
jgi:hypothetical protein